MTAAIAWPADLSVFEAADWHLSGNTQSPGTALDGREQLVWRENRVWRGTLKLPALMGSQTNMLRAVADQLRGRFGRLEIPICNRFTARYGGDATAFWLSQGVTAQQIIDGYLRFSDSAAFGDGTGFALPGYSAPVVAYDAPAGASRIALDGYLGRHLSVGAYFAIDNFLYRVQSNADGDVRFNPPLRTAATPGTAAEVTDPKIHVRLSNDDGLRIVENHNRITPPITFDVVEAFDR